MATPMKQQTQEISDSMELKPNNISPSSQVNPIKATTYFS